MSRTLELLLAAQLPGVLGPAAHGLSTPEPSPTFLNENGRPMLRMTTTSCSWRDCQHKPVWGVLVLAHDADGPGLPPAEIAFENFVVCEAHVPADISKVFLDLDSFQNMYPQASSFTLECRPLVYS